MADRDYSVLEIKDTKLLFRNFEGRKDKFNPSGKRTFSVLLSQDQANELKMAGPWNVKALKPRDEYSEIEYHLPIEVSFRLTPPSVWIITSKGKRLLKEEDLLIVDHAEVTHVDVNVTPSYWTDDNGADHIKAYLKSIFITIFEDELDLKYADVPTLDD